MATGERGRKLVIQELPQGQGGSRPDRGARFEFDRQTQSSHRGSWKVGIKVRTTREDYAGTDEVTEQVLGTNFQPFEMAGVWDSRYSSPYSPTWALDTYHAFRDMVRRANPVQVTLETEIYVGIITDFEREYDKEWRIGWRFTLSPHYQKSSGDVRKTGLVPRQTPSARAVVQQIATLVNTLQSVHASAPAPYMVGTLYSDVQTQINSVQRSVSELRSTVENQVVPITAPRTSPLSPFSRMVQSLEAVVASTANVLYLVQGATNYSSASFVSYSGGYSASSASLAYDLAQPTMDFDVWRSGVGSVSRQVVYQSTQLAKSLRSQVKPDVQAVYIPRPGESLYHVSNVVYGTPDGWRDIYDRNNLVQLTLQGTENLIIPARGTGER